MKAKLTLEIDAYFIKQAKKYAMTQGISLSELVENYFVSLDQNAKCDESNVFPLTCALRGVIKER